GGAAGEYQAGVTLNPLVAGSIPIRPADKFRGSVAGPSSADRGFLPPDHRPRRRRGADGRAFPADRRKSKRRVALMEPPLHPRSAAREGCASTPDRRSTSPIALPARPPWAGAAGGNRR